MPVVAALFHGEQLIPIFLLALAVVAAILLFLSWLIVRLLRPRIGRGALFIAPAPFVLAAVVVLVVIWVNTPNSGPPKIVAAGEASRLAANVSSFSYSGLGFFNGKLYVGTNIGLLEIDKGRLSRIFRPQKPYAVVSGPWIDFAHKALWLVDAETHELLRFDGANWSRMSMPVPTKGYYSRGDVLEGIRPIGNKRGFWMASGGSAWEWSTEKAGWNVLTVKNVPRYEGGGRVNEILGVIPLEGDLGLLWRHELMAGIIRDNEEYQSDGVTQASDAQLELPNRFGRFLADTWAVAQDAAYICTQTQELLRVSSREISSAEAPGACETVASTPDGHLIASIRGKGIYRYAPASGWNLRAPHPYASGSGEYWTHIADNGSEIACAINAKPVPLRQAGGTDIKFTENAPTVLWVWQGGEFKQIKIR